MRILTLWEPWATLMALGAKRIETRSWSTRYRGPLAIHAAKGGLNAFISEADMLTHPYFNEALSNATMRPGHILAVVTLVECAPVEKCHRLGEMACNWKWEREQAFGNYSPGRFAWITANLFRLPQPIAHKGGQGLRLLPAEVVAQIKGQGWKEAGMLEAVPA